MLARPRGALRPDSLLPHVLARATLLTWGSSARNRPGPTPTESSSPSRSGRAVGSSEKPRGPRGPRPRPSRARVCPARPRPRAQCSAVHVAPPSALGSGGRGCLRGTGASRALGACALRVTPTRAASSLRPLLSVCVDRLTSCWSARRAHTPRERRVPAVWPAEETFPAASPQETGFHPEARAADRRERRGASPGQGSRSLCVTRWKASFHSLGQSPSLERSLGG